ncbi:AraC family transcriptional regulator [Oleiagrimonas sp. MCCC 1A03011]|uniref:AraC family transcriptional regulator n=1 Tax=Oleiagrimonas sp. MCCC 1A03011 TaxID=1926883 RepID=UPI000DC6053C|nr:AraC family transcriptional regulator [Oleiagrimonas sp. MCCC 1A03011]RAP58339.1 AraC family transcriptional regulator [Oleiagrimonas sp. MCCC 1A03011]
MQSTQADAYAQRFEAVFAHIERHFAENLTVERLSRVAHFSRFHFHRQFTQYAGISVSRYIQLTRLRNASYRLVFEDRRRIIDIALEAGFESAAAFSRAFRTAFGQSPSQFRKRPAWQPWRERYRLPVRERRPSMDVHIIDFPTTRIATLEHRDAPERVNDTARTFIEWRKETGLSPVASSDTFGIAYDDPDTTHPAAFRFDICGSIEDDVPANPQGVVTRYIPGGRCAVARHHGSHERLGEVAYYLYRDWLPESGEELRDYPLFFHYRNLIPDTPEHELITDVHLPLR